MISSPTIYDTCLTQVDLSEIKKLDFTQERSSSSWKATIQLNLIRHVLTVLNALEQEATMACPPSSIAVPILPDRVPGPSQGMLTGDLAQLSGLNPTSAFRNCSSGQTASHHALRLRLSPLAQIESNFAKQLTQSSFTPGTSDEPTVNSYATQAKHFGHWSTSRNASTFGLRLEEEVGLMVESFKEDIATLWNDKIVRELLQERNVRFDLDGEFFLDDLDRVCAPDYEPSDGKYKSFDIPSHWSLSAKN